MQDRLKHVHLTLGVLRSEEVTRFKGDLRLELLGQSLIKSGLDFRKVLNNKLQGWESLGQMAGIMATGTTNLGPVSKAYEE